MSYLKKFKLINKLSLVTGGSGGIGKEICKALLDAGSNVIIADINKKKSNILVNQLKKKYKNNSITFYELDGTSEKSILELSKFIKTKYKKLDILINCIGVCLNINSEKMTKVQWDKVININLNSFFYICKEIGKIFIKQKKGVIVNIGSNSGLIVDKPQPQSSYNASKGGVHQLTKSLACEWSKHNIRVNAIAPGYVATEMTLLGRKKPEWFKYWLEMSRLGNPVKSVANLSKTDNISGENPSRLSTSQ